MRSRSVPHHRSAHHARVNAGLTLVVYAMILSACAFSASCSSGAGSSKATDLAPSSLRITTTNLKQGAVGSSYSAQLSASGGVAPYTWSISTGSVPTGINLAPSSGMLTGDPSQGGNFSFTVRVTDSSSPAQTATQNIAVAIASSGGNAEAGLQITTTALPGGTVGSGYTGAFAATGGTPPYSWSLLNGQLPNGVSFSASSGTLGGTPAAAGVFTFSVGVKDTAGTSTSAGFSLNIVQPAASSFGHVFIVVEENSNYSSVVGNSSMPYLNSLIANYGLATQYYANTHPSIGNYMMLTTGQVLTNDDSQTPQSFPVSADNVVRELIAAGKTWKDYAEDLPSVGYTGGDTGNYAVRHNPLAYLTDVQNSPAEKQNLVPFTQLAADMADNNLANYSFIAPNLCDDAHNCGLSTADSWLKTNISPLIQNSIFQKDGLLVIVFDESGSDNTNGGGRVAAVLISPAFSKVGYKSTALYQHQNVLRLMLEGLGVKNIPGAGASAADMNEFFSF